jgi:quercetin dioxygenase-like cupin family protein
MNSDTRRKSEKIEPVTKLADLVDYEEGSVVSKTVLERKSASVAIYAFYKFQEIVEHILPYDALFYVLEGEAEVVISGKHCTVKAGEMITFPANKPHSISTKCKFKMLLISLKE